MALRQLRDAFGDTRLEPGHSGHPFVEFHEAGRRIAAVRPVPGISGLLRYFGTHSRATGSPRLIKAPGPFLWAGISLSGPRPSQETPSRKLGVVPLMRGYGLLMLRHGLKNLVRRIQLRVEQRHPIPDVRERA